VPTINFVVFEAGKHFPKLGEQMCKFEQAINNNTDICNMTPLVWCQLFKLHSATFREADV
jgi:hypothetical protein